MLFIVPTPVGNLEDITARALRVLGEVDLILAEDTRVSGKLLKHFAIDTPLKAYHAHNEHKTLQAVVDELVAGKQIALVSDAGTPGISDPAFLLVRECHRQGVEVTCLPGATALIPALVMSGFPTDNFRFVGFLPHKKGRQTKWLAIAADANTQVLYESPHRLPRFLREASEHLDSSRQIAIIREISKVHEEVHRGNAEELLKFFEQNPSKAKGEIVVVIDRAE